MFYKRWAGGELRSVLMIGIGRTLNELKRLTHFHEKNGLERLFSVDYEEFALPTGVRLWLSKVSVISDPPD